MGRGARHQHAQAAALRGAGGLAVNPRYVAVQGWLQVLADHHPYTHDHSREVGRLSGLLADSLGLSAGEREQVKQSALMHDIGKLAVPVSLLDGTTRDLSDEEWGLLQAHADEGHERMAADPALRPLAPAVRGVHERWDGRGYPDALSEQQIPVGARMIAICDAYEAMTSPQRLYKSPMTHEQAIACLQENAGRQFDPALVECFVALGDAVSQRP